MTIGEMSRILGLEDLTPELASGDEAALTGGYVSDLLSDVLAHAPRGGLLVTVQVHMNVVAVAVHAGLTAVVFVSGRRPQGAVIERARMERVRLFASHETGFDLVGRLYERGVRGHHE